MNVAVAQDCPAALLPVRTLALPVSDEFRTQIYLRSQAGQYRLYRGTNACFDVSDLNRLIDSGVSTVYLEGSEYNSFLEHVRSILPVVVKDESIAVSRRFGLLNEVVRGCLRDTFRWGNLPHAVKTAGELAENAVDLICRDDFLASDLGAMLCFDYATSTHSANVSYYCILLARLLGLTDRTSLLKIGTGALLHDIGKLHVPERLIVKRGKLTDPEREIVKRHTSLGLLDLGERDSLEFGQLMMVYQHHERVDGSGYPVRLAGEDIHEWARLCAVVDVFEALTSRRPYRQRLSIEDALEFMQCRIPVGLDPEFLRCWRMHIGVS